MARPRLRTGETLDGFLIGRLVHRGGMAMLFEVTRPDLDTPMVLKAPLLLEGEDPAAIVGFEMEQMILPRLAGPHVPRFIAAGDLADQPYIVMERIPGAPLRETLPNLPLPVAEVAATGARIATALHDIHRQHVVHLDVKPSNILFRPGGEAVLIDYGLAHHDQLPDLMQEEFRLPYGTAPYMAPEQVLGLRSDPRSDIFALGVLMYFFATGTRPFGDPQHLRSLKARLWRDPHPPRRLRPDIPPWFQEILLHCLEVNPAWRYPTAAQLAFDLQHADQVKLTARSERMRRDPWTTVLQRRFNGDTAGPMRRQAIAEQLASAPIIAVAIDLEAPTAMTDALRDTVSRLLAINPALRLACLNVMRLGRVTLDSGLDGQGQNRHVHRLVELRHWANPFRLPEARISLHVLEAMDEAEAILDYARANHVDHIVLGASNDTTLRRLLGTTSATVASRAPCSVTIVRPRRWGS